MGDMLTLIEQAEKVFEKEKAEEAAAKMLEGEFTLADFLDQLQQLKKMGSLQGIMGMMPGMPKEMKNAEIPEDQVRRTEAIIFSMTAQERANPELINGSRRVRISKGSGTTVADVNRFVKQFSEMKKMMKQMGGKSSRGGKSGKSAKGLNGSAMPDELAAALSSRLGPR